jgi:hypothetical protein
VDTTAVPVGGKGGGTGISSYLILDENPLAYVISLIAGSKFLSDLDRNLKKRFWQLA